MVLEAHLPLPRHSQSECLVVISTTLPAAEFCKQKVLVAEKIPTQIAESLQLQNKDSERKPGRPKGSISPTSYVGWKPSVPAPIPSVRYDSTSHWPEIDGNLSRCRRCDMTCTVKCSKCGVRLCLNKDRNCFKDYHMVDSLKFILCMFY